MKGPAFAASVSECEVETQIGESYPGYRFEPEEPVFRRACEAVERAGLTAHAVDSGGGAGERYLRERRSQGHQSR